MNKEPLANKYRPQTFNEVCSQESIVQILQNQIKNNSLPHALLLSGPSGVGKTTICRLIANQIKAEYKEVNGADKNGVEECRGLIEEALRKSLISDVKVICIDECHMISKAGQNSLLKIFEDCPAHVIFMLATTNTEKILPTILSRLQQFKLSRIPTDKIFNRIKYVCEQENIKYEEEALRYISKLADGGMRTALSYLDTILSLNGEITTQNTITALGISNISQNMDLLYCLYQVCFNEDQAKKEKYSQQAINLLEMIYNSGYNMSQFTEQFYQFILDVNKYKMFNNSFANTQLPETEEIKQEFERYNLPNLIKLLNRFQLFRETLNKQSINLIYALEGFVLTQIKGV